MLVCLAAGAYAVNGYGRPDLSDLDDFDGPVTPTTPAAPTGTGTPATPSTPTSTVRPVAPVSPARPAVPVGTLRPLGPVVRPGAVPFAPARRPAIFAPGAGVFVPSGLPGEEWKPYSFGYDTTDEFGTRLFHNEQSDNKNAKTGTYGYRDANGIFRTVSYVADADGYRATIDTNEPGTAPGASADAVFNANPRHLMFAALEGTREATLADMAAGLEARTVAGPVADMVAVLAAAPVGFMAVGTAVGMVLGTEVDTQAVPITEVPSEPDIEVDTLLQQPFQLDYRVIMVTMAI
ncbi:hypothetical protein HPB49_013190 [Dermacentor silvarum]|uniref:Uncharacterized protein n=1 Tax=Dermacentor silvarum TaxID=543639 RepID=A0ACB8DDI2_DERSI|nr:hypothetical protein HPB49_013190 [Dermacentor silvarum]